MSDLTVYAEALISAVARAFYEDDVVCLIDILLRDKFLRDDDMGPRLSLPAKQLRRTLQFLQDEFLVKYESVDDLSAGGSQATKFWYVDYNHAVNVIRLRIYMLKKKLEDAELRARSSSFYLCPGYKKKTCNGQYTETEAQQILDYDSGLFLCQECFNTHQNNPEPPTKSTYTLQLVDNTKDLRLAMDNLRRVNVQLSAKMVGNQQLRVGVYDLLKKVRIKGKGPLSNNLPSENRSMGIGSKRLAGTGRTAGIKAKKLAQQGIVANDGGVGHRGIGGARRSEEGDSDLNFLKNARGEEIAFEVEKGGGARANLLAMRTRRRQKLLDAAASRVCAINRNMKKSVRTKKADDPNKDQGPNKPKILPGSPPFLYNNIDRIDPEQELAEKNKKRNADEMDSDEEEEEEEEAEEFKGMTQEERQKAYNMYYKMEIARQTALLENMHGNNDMTPATVLSNGCGHHPPRSVSDDNGAESDVDWEDGLQHITLQ